MVITLKYFYGRADSFHFRAIIIRQQTLCMYRVDNDTNNNRILCFFFIKLNNINKYNRVCCQ